MQLRPSRPFPDGALFQRRSGERHKRHGPGSFDGRSQHPLMFGTIAGNPPGSDFAPFGCEIPQSLRFFVVNYQAAVGTESANLPPVERAPHLAFACGSTKSICHDLTFFPIFLG
jgi:hypothetical protein